MEKQIYQNMIEYMENQRNSKRWGWEDSDFSDSMSQDTIYGWEEAFDEMIAEMNRRIKNIEEEEDKRQERYNEEKQEAEKQAAEQANDDAYHYWKREQEAKETGE